MTASALPAGSIVAGNYRVLRALSEGAMGAVYVVEQVTTRKERALKVMQPHIVDDPRLRERFAQEAQIGSHIDSEHVVEVIDAGVDAQLGLPWLAMELLRGETLGALSQRGPVPPATVREIFGQLCHALAAAHDRQIVHRDLKPDNVFLATARREGVPFTVKVLDFGIAKIVTEAQTRGTATIGTPLFMAPEQATPGAAISPATDVWALGLIAFRLLTGRDFWRSGNVESSTPLMVLQEIALESIPPASARAAELGVASLLPAGFDGWFARTTVRDPAARFPQAREARAAFEALVSSSGSSAHGPPAAPRAGQAIAAPIGAPLGLAHGSQPTVGQPPPTWAGQPTFGQPPAMAPLAPGLTSHHPPAAPGYYPTAPGGPYPPAAAQGFRPPAPRKSRVGMWVAIGVGGALLLVIVAGLLVARSVKGVGDYVRSSKTAEAKNALQAIARSAREAFDREWLASADPLSEGDPSTESIRRLCGSAEPVPASVPRGVKYAPSPTGDFQTGDERKGWRCLHFDMVAPHYYQYTYTVGGPFKSRARGNVRAVEGPDHFEIAAEGDLDGNGETSLFAIVGRVDPQNGRVELSELFSDKPNE